MRLLAALFVAIAFVAASDKSFGEAVVYLIVAVVLLVLADRGVRYRPRWERRVRSGKDRPW